MLTRRTVVDAGWPRCPRSFGGALTSCGDDLATSSEDTSYTLEQLLDQPTFARLDAVEAGQMKPWKSKSMDDRAQASYMTELAGFLSQSEPLT